MSQAPLNRPPDDALGRLAAIPFFGRAPLLSAARAALEASRDRRGHALLLIGEAGIGKTRMADEIVGLAQSSGLRPLSARCHEMEGAPALWPWIQIVRQLCSGIDAAARDVLLGEDAGPLAHLVPELTKDLAQRASVAVPHDGDDRFRLFESVTTLLRRAASKAPLLVVLDDLHWSDPASVLLARYAVRELRRDPIVFLGLYRDTDVDPEDPLEKALGDLTSEAEVFRLEGLDASEVTRFVEHVAGFEVSGVLSAALHAQTGGNPLFLAEILRLLAIEERLGAPDAPTPDAIPLPLTVRHTLQRRLDALSTGTRAILEQAAVLGTEFDREILEAATPSGADLASALDESMAVRLTQGVSNASGRFRFVHDLIRETLDAGLSIGDRARLHRQAADVIARTRAATLEDHYAALAHHYLESASTGTAREAVDFGMRGAARAVTTFSFELAVQLLQRALRALDIVDAGLGATPDSERTRTAIQIEMGHALWQSGQRRQARAAHRIAAELARRLEDTSLFAQAAIGLAGRNDVPMDFPDASVSLMEEALEALPRTDSRLRVRLLSHLVRAKYFGDEREQLLEWAREAVEIASRLDDSGALFAALEALHYALLVPAHLEERLTVSKQLPELARRTGSLRFEALAWLWRTFDLLQVPDIAAADAAIASFEEAARALRQPFYEWLAMGLRATRAQMRGQLDEAERLVFGAFELGQRADSPNARLFFGTQLFHLRVEQGRSDELMPIMQKIVDESPALPVFRIGVPLIHAIAGREQDARQSFEQVAANDFEDVPHDLHWLPMLTSAAAVCAYLGDTRRAEVLLEALRPEEGRIVIAGVATYWAGSVDRSLGQLEETLGRLDEAERHFASAAHDAALAGALLLEARTLLDQARVLRRRGSADDLELAIKLEERAAAIYRELGVTPPTPAELAQPVETKSATRGERASSRFLRRGRDWLLDYEGSEIELPDSKGLVYLRRLVSAPEQEIHVVDLVAPEMPDESPARSRESGVGSARHSAARPHESPVEVLDPESRAAYRERLRELEALRSEAERDHDLARMASLSEESEQIEAELRAAFGLGGRPRAIGDPVERARKSVYNRIRAAIKRIEDEHPALGRHFGRSIRTGTMCSYQPDRPTEWLLD